MFLLKLLLRSIHRNLKPGSSKVSVCIKNLTGKLLTHPSHITVVTVTAANTQPPMLSPKTLVIEEGNLGDTPLKEKSPSTAKPVATQEQMVELFIKLDISGLDTWDLHYKKRPKASSKSMLTSFHWVISIWARLLWQSIPSKSMTLFHSRIDTGRFLLVCLKG